MNPPRTITSPAPTAAAYACGMAGIGLFSVMDMVMKGLTIAAGIFAVMLLRSLVAVVLAGTLFAIYRPAWPDWATLRLHVARGIITALMAVLFFWGLARVPMAQAVALTFIAPPMALLLAAVLLGETLGRRTLAGSLLAAGGVAVIFIAQAQADLGPPALFGSAAVIASAVIYAYNIILMRQQALAARPVEIAFFQNLVVALTMIATVPFVGWPSVGPAHWPEILAAAVLGLGSQLLLAWAYARAGAAYLSTTEYSAFLWAMLLGWLRFGESVSTFTLAGAALILAGCWLAAWASPHPALEASA